MNRRDLLKSLAAIPLAAAGIALWPIRAVAQKRKTKYVLRFTASNSFGKSNPVVIGEREIVDYDPNTGTMTIDRPWSEPIRGMTYLITPE